MTNVREGPGKSSGDLSIEALRLARSCRRKLSERLRAKKTQRSDTTRLFDGGGGGIDFADHGRHFMASILLGRDASLALGTEARGVLNTLRVTAKR